MTRSIAAPYSVEDMVALGKYLARWGLVGVGGAQFRGGLLARALGCGAAEQGAAVIFHDGGCPEQCLWLARFYRWPASAFVDGMGELYLFNSRGELLTGPPPEREPGEGSWDRLTGVPAAYRAALVREPIQPCGGVPPQKTLYFL